jgi:hypothetical protein
MNVSTERKAYMKSYSKKWALKNRDKIRQKYLENKEFIKAKVKLDRLNNPEKYREYNRRKREKEKKERLFRSGGVDGRSLRKQPHTAEKVIYGQYKRNAKMKYRKFKLTFDSFLKKINGSCYYCKMISSNHWHIIRNGKVLYDLRYNGIDRINNDIGYTEENSVSCCRFCNTIKKTFKKDDFEKWLKHIKNCYKEKILSFLLENRELEAISYSGKKVYKIYGSVIDKIKTNQFDASEEERSGKTHSGLNPT